MGQLRLTTYVNSVLDRPVSAANHRNVEAQGAAQATAAVTVNGQTAERQGEYFRRELSAGGTGAAWLNIDLSVAGGASITNRKAYVPPQAESLLYDADGNLKDDGRWEFRWDAENRLVDVWTRASAYNNGIPRERVRFDYDAAGRVLERREFVWSGGAWSGVQTNRYLYDGWQCIAEFNGSGSTRRTHVWGLDLSESRRGAGGLGGLLWLNTATNGTHVAAYDGNGSVLGLIGTDGAVSARYEYGPFGELLRMSGGALAADNPWRWGTKRADPTTDLVHYEYRVYSPRLGRWLSRDPIGEAGGRNLYAFAGNDPVNGQDVLGLKDWLGNPLQEAGTSLPNPASGDGDTTSLLQWAHNHAAVFEIALGPATFLRNRISDALKKCICKSEYWNGIGAGAWDGVKGIGGIIATGYVVSKDPLTAITMAKGAMDGLLTLYSIVSDGEMMSALKTVAPELHALITLSPDDPGWCRAFGSLQGTAAFEVLLTVGGAAITPARLSALAARIALKTGQKLEDVAGALRKLGKLARTSGDLTPSLDSGVWKLRPTARGRAIEAVVSAEYRNSGWQVLDDLTTANNFELVDFQHGNNLVSLKSVDTRGKTWVGRMQGHIDDLAANGATVNGSPANMILDIRVQPGGAAAAQQLIGYGKRQGVTVIIKEFP